jgi:hypothetical protein
MMHQNPTESRKFDIDPRLRVFTTDGDRPEHDALAFYDPTDSAAWLSMNDPVDVREWR